MGPLAARTTPTARTAAILLASASTLCLLAALPGPPFLLIAATLAPRAGAALAELTRSHPVTFWSLAAVVMVAVVVAVAASNRPAEALRGTAATARECLGHDDP